MIAYLRVVLSVVIVASVGLFVPILISMKDTTAVISGFTLAILTPPCIYAICKGLCAYRNEGKEMKKAIMASIIALSAIGLVGCDRVEPGNVGISWATIKALVKSSESAATGPAGIQRFISFRPSSR